MIRRPYLRQRLAATFAALLTANCGDPATAPASVVAAVVLSIEHVTLAAIGDAIALTATPVDHTGAPVATETTWRTSAPAVATVSALGTVAAVDNGVATIVATAGGVSATATVTVAQAPDFLGFTAQPVDMIAGSAMAGVRLSLTDRGGTPLRLAADSVLLVVTDTTGTVETALPTARLVRGLLEVPGFVRNEPRIGLMLRAQTRGITASSIRFDVVAGADVVRITGPRPDTTALLLDGFHRGALANDLRADVVAVSEVGLFRGGLSNEIVALAPGYVPTVITDAGWTAGVDTVELSLAEPVPLPVSIWLATGTAAAEGQAVTQAVAAAGDLFTAAGILLEPTLIDRTDLAQDPRWQDPRSCTTAELLAQEAGRTAGALNLYVTHEANGSARSGFVCPIGGDLAVVGRGVDGGLVAHEFGHAFGLLHVDGLPGFDQQNIMFSNSGTRRRFTDGQIFRMHVEPGSPLALRRPAAERRTCGNGESLRCPRLDLQLRPGQPSIRVN